MPTLWVSWRRTVPISRNGTLQWWRHSGWGQGSDLDDRPGSGRIQSYDTFIVGNTFWEVFWRGNQGWYRRLPIVNEEPDWDNPWSHWDGPLSLGQIPGQFGMQAQSAITVGNILTQSYWRGNQGWYRTVPIVSGIISVPIIGAVRFRLVLG
jgi:hypothetical protein